ncbi:MAG: hypothetical protein ABIG44_02805 [Planctomycetota bacterium]
MFQSASFSGLAVVSVVAIIILVLVAQCVAQEQVPRERRPGAAPPGTHGVPGNPPGLRPEEIEKRISPEEREKLGLPEPTWVARHGKVHPDVRAVLETGQMPWLRFKGWSPIGFEGTAYVAVYLRHEPQDKQSSLEKQVAIKEVQKRVLSKLTAAEFSTVYIFKNTASILGYVNSAGLAKLAADQDVIAVGLDDTPLPEDPPQAMGNEYSRGWRGKVEIGVYEALEKSPDGYVYVIVGARVPQGPGPFDEAYEAMKSETRQLQDRILSALNADEFRLRGRPLSGGPLGYANAAGLAKLTKHLDVNGIGLNQAIRWPRNIKSRRLP